MRRWFTISLMFSAVLVGTSVRLPGQSRPVDELMGRVGAYLTNFVERFSSVVAEEDYQQEGEEKPLLTGSGFGQSFHQSTPLRVRLHSDFLFVRRDMSRQWETFRDVYDVNGQLVRDRHDRLMALFVSPTGSPTDQANQILKESSRYNLGDTTRTVNNPLLALSLFQSEYQTRFQFALVKSEPSMGERVWILSYRERQHPTMLRLPTNQDRPMTGRAWVDIDTGRVLKTELVLAGPDKIVTMFRDDPELAVAVPEQMTDSYERGAWHYSGVASYSHFRRFRVSTTERLQTTEHQK